MNVNMGKKQSGKRRRIRKIGWALLNYGGCETCNDAKGGCPDCDGMGQWP